MTKFFSIPLFCFLVISCKSKTEQIQPTTETITESVYASGIVKTNKQYQVYPMVNGIIKEMLVTEGSLVKPGDPLMRLSNITARLNSENAKIAADYSAFSANTDKINQAKIDIDVAKAKLDNEASLLERQKNLWKEGIGTHNELDSRQLSFTNAQKAYDATRLRLSDLERQIQFQEKQAKKNVEISNNTSGDFTVKSEISGKVYSVYKEKGEMVNTQTPIALIGDAAGFYLELQVDEYDITRIVKGQKVLLNMDSYKGQVFEAVVRKIDPIMNAQSKSFTVEADFIHPPASLYPNLTTEANIVIKVKKNALTIPRSYLVNDSTVMLANKEKRKVTTGLKDYLKAEIIKGLSPTDQLIKPVQ
jgi:multidrug efflux pump subunit AcrA (membrane-fusion protein)